MKIRKQNLAVLGLAALAALALSGCSNQSAMRADTNPDTPAAEVAFPLEETGELSFITALLPPQPRSPMKIDFPAPGRADQRTY